MKTWGNIYFIIVFAATVAYSTYAAINYFVPDVAEQKEDGVFHYDEIESPSCIRLRGNVLFYPGQLLEPSDFAAGLPPEGQSVHVPLAWNSYEGKACIADGKGYGTYYFKVKVDKYDHYGLNTRDVSTAYRIWVNGELLAEKGKVSKKPDDARPAYSNHSLSFHSVDNEVELVMQVSNYDYADGGILNSLIFGKQNDLHAYNSRTLFLEILLLGFILIMAIYHLGLYVHYKHEKSSLYFSLLAIAIAIRQLMYGEKMLYNIIPELDWALSAKLEYATLVLTVPLILLYLRSYFKKIDIRWLSDTLIWSSFAYVALVMIAPVSFTSWNFQYFQWMLMAGAVYCIIFVIRLVWHNKPLGWHFLVGVSVTMLFCSVEILRFNIDPDMPYTLHLGMFVLLFTQSYGLTRKITQGFHDSHRMARMLEEYNMRLTEEVEKRTRELTDANEEVSRQNSLIRKKAHELEAINKRMQELDNYKQTMTHMIIHDLKNPLNIIINLTEDEMLRKISHQMLDQISDIMDIQKHEEAELKPNYEVFELKAVCHTAIEQTAVLSDEKDVKLKSTIPTEAHTLADAELVRRVMVNLLTNAVKYTPRGTEVDVSCKDTGETIRIRIADKGPGVPKEWRERIFEKFSQIEARRSGRVMSTGLGLNFCKIAIEAHGQKMGVEDNKEGGAVFWFELDKAEKTRPVADRASS